MAQTAGDTLAGSNKVDPLLLLCAGSPPCLALTLQSALISTHQLVTTLTGSDKVDPLLLLALGSITKAFVGELVEHGAGVCCVRCARCRVAHVLGSSHACDTVGGSCWRALLDEKCITL